MSRHLAVHAGFATVLATSLLVNASSAQPGRARLPQVGLAAPEPEKKMPWNKAENVFSAKLESVDAGPVARSFPPVYSHTLHLQIETVLRGELKVGDKIDGAHTARQHDPPSFPIGKTCLVAASRSRGRFRVDRIEAADDAKLQQVALECRLPLGWQIRDGKPVSPWVSLGAKAWGSESSGNAELVCSETGRPALLVGGGVSFQVEHVPPKEAIKWTNPDGDGEYRVTVSNTSDQAVEVPALLSRGDEILWAESLVILCQDQVYACPGCKGVASNVVPARLEPGQSVSAVVNALQLEGPEWPRGGYRIEFQFCLGEKSATKSFYYLSRHHDKVRAQLTNE
jgi:hypothetical protein